MNCHVPFSGLAGFPVARESGGEQIICLDCGSFLLDRHCAASGDLEESSFVHDRLSLPLDQETLVLTETQRSILYARDNDSDVYQQTLRLGLACLADLGR